MAEAGWSRGMELSSRLNIFYCCLMTVSGLNRIPWCLYVWSKKYWQNISTKQICATTWK